MSRHVIEWKPIDSAPKDGTRVLLMGRDNRIADGLYRDWAQTGMASAWIWPYIKCEPEYWAKMPIEDEQ